MADPADSTPAAPAAPVRLVTAPEREDATRHAAVVKCLEELLQQARDGVIIGIAVVAEASNGTIRFTDTGTDSMLDWLGKIEQLKWRMQARYWRED